MDIITDQFDDIEATHRKMEEAKRVAADSMTSVLNTAAAANGAGLIAMVGYLPTQDLSAHLLSLLTFAGLMFAAGLMSAGYAKLNAHYRLTVVALGYSQKLQAHHFKERFENKMSREDADTIFESMQAGEREAVTLQDLIRKRRDRWASWSLVTFFLGFVSLGLAVVVQKRTMMPEPFTEQRCIALETDMLRANPTRKDSLGLFQAFGCKPQTRTPIQIPLSSQRKVIDGRA